MIITYNLSALMSRESKPFDVILVWPLQLDLPDTAHADRRREIRNATERRIANGEAGWSYTADRLRRGSSPSEDGSVYAELAYFQPYVQKLLYGAGGSPDDEPVFDLYMWPPAKPLTLRVDEDGFRATFDVERALFYVFDGGFGILSLCLTSQDAVPWDTVRNALCYLRVTTFQHYRTESGGDGSIWVGGGAKERIWIEPIQPAPSPQAKPRDRKKEMLTAIEEVRPRILDHWQHLLNPLLPEGASVRTLGDHRMAVMAGVYLVNPRSLGPDEWYALSEADGAGFLSYSKEFRDNDLRASSYDRWWSDVPWDKLDQRWLAGARTLVQVKGVPEGPVPEHISRMRITFRRQWYQIFLLAHFQRAALLIFQMRIAMAVRLLQKPAPETGDGRKLMDEVELLEREIAAFTSQFWFHEVTAQAQGTDLYALLKRRIDLDRLYREVVDDKATLMSLVASIRERRRNDVLSELSYLGAFFLPLSLALSFLGINYWLGPLREWIQEAVRNRLPQVPCETVAGWVEFGLMAFFILLGLIFGKLLLRRARTKSLRAA